MITIFTPTYNRADLLLRCYESLEKQTCKDFRWLVVDDGSIDDTKKTVNLLKKQADFKVEYLYRENGGKHRAFNLAVSKCKTDYILILDSDDLLAKDAIEVLNDRCKKIKENEKICGIIGNKGDLNGNRVGTKIPDVEYVSGLELYQKMHFKGETLRLYKTTVLKEFPFPEIPGENFVSENVVFDKIDKKYKMLTIPEVLYLFEYQNDGLSSCIKQTNKDNPIGYSLSLRSAAETALTIKKKIGVTALYILWAKRFHIKDSYNNYSNKIVYLACLPVSFVLWILKVPKFYFDTFREVKDE